MDQLSKIYWSRLVAFFGVALLAYSGIHKGSRTTCDENTSSSYRIAFFAGANIAAIESLQKGVLASLSKCSPSPTMTTYFYYQDKTLLKNQLDEAISQPYNLFITVGAIASQMACELVTKRKSSIPVVFSGVINPAELGIAPSSTSPHLNATGLSAIVPHYEHHVKAMFVINPALEKVLIIYDPKSTYLEQQKKELEKALRSHGISVATLDVFDSSEVYQKSKSIVVQTRPDIVFIMRDYVTTQAVDVLVKLCEEEKIPLFASDAYSAEKGAAFAYGYDDYDYGIVTGSLIARIIKENIPANSLPVIHLDDTSLCKLTINVPALERQGVTTPLCDLLSIPNSTILRSS